MVFALPSCRRWDVARVVTLSEAFAGGKTPNKFNQPLSRWDVSQVTNMNNAFLASTFNQVPSPG